MNQDKKHKIITFLIALVWIINGLFCKVLNLVPRHQEIVDRILASNNSRVITILIGASEVIMAIWILCNYKSKLSAMIQMLIVATMNVIELIVAKDLLLWGKFNTLFVLLFIILVFYTNFKIKKIHGVIS